ncbi:zinc ribbon domain-containing protein [Proteinivorax hydrogeniformans]|uniref:Zinc ribbon domain-containing protein n=1 Tax=Proteinivorax hydrogeniformans TaxID=1826727 RepID=A0AAU8HU74_9FIRM
MNCPNCGKEIHEKAVICIHCGVKTEENVLESTNDQAPQKSNGVGITGFVLALVSLFLPIPGIDIFIGFIALILSIVGMVGNRANKGFAIAGLVISIFAIFGGILLWSLFFLGF